MVNVGGYNSDTSYSRVNQIISPPPPAAVVQVRECEELRMGPRSEARSSAMLHEFDSAAAVLTP